MSSVVVIGEWTIDYYGIPWWNSFPPMCSPPENCIETRCVARWVTRGGACAVEWQRVEPIEFEWQEVEPVQFEWQWVEPIEFEWQGVEPIQFEWQEGDYVKIIWQEMKQENFNWQEAQKKKIKVEWQGLNLRLLLKIGWSIYNSITMMGKIWTFFLCCRYWSAGWMAGQNLSYCGTYYDMFFESLSICLLGSFAWFSKNFYIYIYVFSTDLLLIF